MLKFHYNIEFLCSIDKTVLLFFVDGILRTDILKIDTNILKEKYLTKENINKETRQLIDNLYLYKEEAYPNNLGYKIMYKDNGNLLSGFVLNKFYFNFSEEDFIKAIEENTYNVEWKEEKDKLTRRFILAEAVRLSDADLLALEDLDSHSLMWGTLNLKDKSKFKTFNSFTEEWSNCSYDEISDRYISDAKKYDKE